MKNLDKKWKGSDTIVNNIEQVINRYKEFAPEYNLATLEWGYESPNIISDLASHHLSKKLKIIDAGCGSGLCAQSLSNKGYKNIVGFDISPDMLQLAYSSQCYSMVNIVDMLKQPYPYLSNYFDGLTCGGVLSFFTDITPIIKEFFRIVKSGGILIFTLRDDLYKKYKQDELFSNLIDQGNMELIEALRDQPYLPNHLDYGNEIRITYYVFRILKI